MADLILNDRDEYEVPEDYSFAEAGDDNIEVSSIEDDLLENIRHQVANSFGDFTGEVGNTFDYILHYITDVYDGDSYTIENFETLCSHKSKEVVYDKLTAGLIDIFEKLIGVKIDIHRETIHFSDLYDIYCIFVLSLKSTLEFCTVNKFVKNGTKLSDIKPDAISEYCLSDEFSPTDDFIPNAAEYSQDMALLNLKEKVDDHIITVDPVIFGRFIYDFITSNDITISEKVLNG